MARSGAAFCATPAPGCWLPRSAGPGLCARRRPRACADVPRKTEPSAAPATPPPPPPPSAKSDNRPAASFNESEVAASSYLEVPGKIVLSPEELAQQKQALMKLEVELRKKRLQKEYEESKKFGWVPFAEKLNGRFAMFFFVVGLLTEYWTGYTIPQQVELMANTFGIYF